MVTWSLENSIDKKTWDNYLECLGSNFYQCYDYGEYQKSQGWNIVRFLAKNLEGKVIGIFQAAYKKLPLGIALFINTGGPIGPIESWNSIFNTENLKKLNLRLIFIRIFPQEDWTPQKEAFLLNHGWRKVPYLISSGKSILMDLRPTLEGLKTNLSRNWKRNYNKSLKSNIILKVNDFSDTHKFISLFKEMTARKNLEEIVTEDELHKIIEFHKDHLLLFSCFDQQGVLLSVRMVMVFGNKAFDFLAASNVKARNLSATYFAMWKIVELLKEKGVTGYDLGGIDPEFGKGVYRFKTGLCKNEIQYLGEYDWSNWPLFGFLCSKAWQLRNKIR